MSFFRKRPRGRRRANLQIDYPFDRLSYVRFRLWCWGETRLHRGAATFRRMATTVRQAALATVGTARRWARKRPAAAAPDRQRTWLGSRPGLLTPEASAE